MLESNENNGIHPDDGTNGNGTEVLKTTASRKRILTRDLSVRIAELEGKIDILGAAVSKLELLPHLEQKMAELADQIAKLDERVTKIAHAVAQSNLMRGPLS